MWQCRNRWRKLDRCKTHNVQDKALHYVIHEAVRDAAVKRKLTSTLTDILGGVVSEDRMPSVRKWLRSLPKMNISQMLSDEEDLSLVVSRIVVKPDGTLDFHFIDGSKLNKKIPKCRRKTNEVICDE